jgi:hypothetical protein
MNRYPTYKILTKFGNFDAIRTQIDAEVVSNKSVSKGKLLFTQNWILHPYFSGLHVIFKPTLVWVYTKHQATRHSINFIPTGTTHEYSVLINYTEPAKEQGFVTIRSLEIKTHGDMGARDILDYMLIDTPWIVAGYTPEIDNLWKSNTSEMLATITNRYNSFISGALK